MIYVEFVFYGNTFQIPYPKVRPIFHALILCGFVHSKYDGSGKEMCDNCRIHILLST